MSGQFVDANVLVYAFGQTDDQRHALSQSLVLRLLKENTLVSCVQVLKELYVVATRKVRPGLSDKQASLLVRHLTEAARIVDDTVPLLERALELSSQAKISLWDASVLAAAEAAGCDEIYSEDLQLGKKTIPGIRVTNPFA